MTRRASFADCQDCRCLSARRKAQRLTRLYDEKLRAHGLTINQFSMLATLILAGQLPVASLAEHLGVDRTTMTRNLALGQSNGLVAVAEGRIGGCVSSASPKKARRLRKRHCRPGVRHRP